MSNKSKKRPAKKAVPKAGNAGATKLVTGLTKLGEMLNNPEFKAKIEEARKADQARQKGDDAVVEAETKTETEKISLPLVEGKLRPPDKMVPRGDRICWYWNCSLGAEDKNSSVVMATYTVKDSVYTEDVLNAKPGARKGDFTIDIIGYNGSALFHQWVDQAKSVAEAIFSAVGWENEWRKHYVDPGYVSEGGEMADIPHDDPGPTVDGPWTMPQQQIVQMTQTEIVGNDPVVTEGGRIERGPVTFSIPREGVPPEGLASNECPDIRIHTGPVDLDKPETEAAKYAIPETEAKYLGNVNDNCIGEPVTPEPWTPPVRIIKDIPQA